MKLNLEISDAGVVTGTVEGVAPASAPAGDPAYATQFLDKPWPHIILIKGLQIMAKAPINPAWKPSMADYVWGSPPAFVHDGANGDELDPPRPLRSPMGFPQGWAVIKGEKEPIGTVSVYYDGHQFNSDEEVLDYIKRVDARDAALAEGPGWQGVWAAYQARGGK